MIKKTIYCIVFLYGISLSQCPTPEFKEPDSLEILLQSQIYNSIRQPLFHFQYAAAGGTDKWISYLLVNQINYQDSVILDVRGYYEIDYLEHIRKNELIINFITQFARKSIIVPQEILKDKTPKKFIILLKNKRNIIILEKNNLLVKLVPIELHNIKIYELPNKNFSEVLLFPRDVYRVYIAGKTKRNIDYLSSIIEFSKTLGFTLANDKYPQIPIGFSNSNILIVTNDEIYSGMENSRAKQLGELPNHPGVKVLIAKISSSAEVGNIRMK